MSENSESPFPYMELGSTFILGFVIGMALKKGIMVLMLLAGAGLMFVLSLEHQGALTINEHNLENVVNMGTKGLHETTTFLENKLEQYQGLGSVSAITGFLAGIKYA